VVYGPEPPSIRSFTQGEACVLAVQAQMQDHDKFLLKVRGQLKQAQQQYKHFYDCKHRDISFTVGQWVWLRMIHRPLALLDVKGRSKLGPKFYGSILILEKIVDAAYLLKPSAGAKLHDVFHVGLLKSFKGELPIEMPALPSVRHGRVCAEPKSVLCCRLARGH
jgi:hypothetical protein